MVTTNFGFFTPFVEAEYVQPTLPISVTSSSNTLAIDYLRQGVEVLTEGQFYGGVLPQLGTDDHIGHQIDIETYGQSDEFIASVTFQELVTFNPVTFIQSTDSTPLMFPVVLDDPAYSDPERLGGFIEPLTVGSRDPLVSVTEFEPHDIRAHLMGGNEDSLLKTDYIVTMIDLKEQLQFQAIFVDGVDMMGTGSALISLGGLFPEGEKLIRPFDETAYTTRVLPSGSLSDAGLDMFHVIQELSGADSSNYIPGGFLSAGTGFVYDNSEKGVDSLAFGGLKL